MIDNLPTSKTAGVFIGLVEIKGTAEAEQPIISYLAESQCVYYSYSVEEHWRRTVTETYTDSKGKSQTRTRTESGWSTVASDTQSISFYLHDDTGLLLIHPDGAKIEANNIYLETEQRIALVRAYFNDIATQHNTRLEIIPDRFFADIAGLKRRPLMEVADFERAAVKVKLSD